MKLRTILISCLLLYFINVGLAHVGGHHSKADDKHWTYTQDGVQKSFKGSFYLYKEGLVVLEGANHQMINIPLDAFIEADAILLKANIDKIASLNGQKKSIEKESSHHALSGHQSEIGIFYGLLLLLASVLIFYGIKKSSRKKKSKSSVLAIAVLLIAFSSCKKEGCTDSSATNYDSKAKKDNNSCTYPSSSTLGTGLSLSEMTAAFTPYTKVSTRSDATYFYVESDGIPNHDNMMVGITAWIAQVPIVQPYTGDNAWSIPLNPEYATEVIKVEDHFQRGALGIAVNGIPIFNPINASGLVSKDIGELDAYGGHSGRGDDYHYHTAPLHLESTSGTKPIAFALDGFPVYGSTEPDGSTRLSLDAFHGHEWNGTYHYHGTTDYPYMVAAMRGKVTLSGTAPQDQIEPQPKAGALRGDPHPINSDNLIITACDENSTQNGYTLKYTKSGVEGSIVYSWDNNNLFTFIFNDVDGSTTTETYQRK